MSAFPITEQPSERTRIEPDAGKRSFRTMGGGTRGRTAFDRVYYRLTFVDEYLSLAEVASVLAHYDGDPDAEHTRTIDGTGYTFQYLDRPRIVGYHGEFRTVQTLARGYET